MKPLLVGEANPYGGDPEFALYPHPRGCSGHRLCEKVMGLTDREYLARFDRVNLCPERWVGKQARARADALRAEYRGGVLVLLGAKVTRAFGLLFDPFLVERRGPVWPATASDAHTTTCVVLPHPSGLSRAWNAPGAFDRARAALREAGVLSP